MMALIHRVSRALKKFLSRLLIFSFPASVVMLLFYVFYIIHVTTVERQREIQRITDLQSKFYIVNETIVNPHNYNLMIKPKIRCRNAYKNGPYLVMLIPSTIGREHRRHVIRTTWGTYIRNKGAKWPNSLMPDWTRPERGNFKFYFLFGAQPNYTYHEQLKLENEKYGDVIQEDFIDTYANLSLKSIMALKWATLNCIGAKYIMKVDDDVFVNMPNLVRFLGRVGPREGIAGVISKRSLVWREGKWEIAIEDFPFSRYPKYAVGCAYLMPLNIAAKLYETSLHIAPIYLEDVYVTGILAKLNNVRHYHDKGFSDAIRKPPTACRLIKGISITSTNWKQPNGVIDLWKDLWDIDQGRNNRTC